MPPAIFTQYKKLLNPNPKVRMSPSAFLEAGMAQTGEGNGFFVNNSFVRICEGLDQFSIKGEAEKAALLKYIPLLHFSLQIIANRYLLRSVKDAAATLPPEFASYRVLPSLVSALEFGGATANNILPLVLQLGVITHPINVPCILYFYIDSMSRDCICLFINLH